jgi:hypothetical protein
MERMTLSRSRNSLATIALASVFIAAPALAQSSPDASAPGDLRVCCRPLIRWQNSTKWFLRLPNRVMVRRFNHCYIERTPVPDTSGAAGQPTAPTQTVGIHGYGPRQENQFPNQNDESDGLRQGGSCKRVKDATPEKIRDLEEEIRKGLCYSCGKEYHNRPDKACFNNSNTYIYDLIKGAGMTPPPMKNAPGYRAHHACAASGPHQDTR